MTPNRNPKATRFLARVPGRPFGPFVFALIFLCAALSFAPHIRAARLPRNAADGDAANGAVRLNSSFAFADFDGDRQPDLATAEIEHSDAHFTRYRIRLRFQSGISQRLESIGVAGSFGLPQISAVDVNGDNVPDIVITAAGQRQPIAIFINDGRGTFSAVNPGDFRAALVGSHGSWSPATGRFQDLPVVIQVRTPQADAGEANPSLFSLHVVLPSFPAHSILPLDWKRSSSRDRAPPLSV